MGLSKVVSLLGKGEKVDKHDTKFFLSLFVHFHTVSTSFDAEREKRGNLQKNPPADCQIVHMQCMFRPELGLLYSYSH